MSLIRISAVSYLNTYPFVFGIKTSGELYDIKLELDVPSMCAEKLRSGNVDLALVPVGAIPEMTNPLYLTDYCIGAEKAVKTVVLLSQVPIGQIRHIHLDNDSKTSVKLVQVLAKNYWNIQPQWHPLQPEQASGPGSYEALVAIGDKTFDLVSRYPYVYDLAEEWIRFTNLPFIFAVWMSLTPLPERFLEKFNRALQYGIMRKREIPEFFKDTIPTGIDAVKYLEDNISYPFDKRKKQGLTLFLSYLNSLT